MSYDLLADFLVRLVAAISWPAAIVLSIALLRPYLANILPSLQKIRYEGVEMEFNSKVQEARKELTEISGVGLSNNVTDDFDSQVKAIESLLEVSPRAAVIQAGELIDEQIYRAAVRVFGPNSSIRLNGTATLDEFARMGTIEPELVRVIQELRKLKDNSAYTPGYGVSRGMAAEYVKVIGLLLKRLSSIESPKSALSAA
jgi:hypothetical protein